MSNKTDFFQLKELEIHQREMKVILIMLKKLVVEYNLLIVSIKKKYQIKLLNKNICVYIFMYLLVYLKEKSITLSDVISIQFNKICF